MEDRRKESREEIRIDLCALGQALLRRAWLMGLIGVICGLGAFLVARFCVTPAYEVPVKFYVNNSAVSAASISSGDLTTSRNLVDSCIVILNTRESLEEVIACAGVGRTTGEVGEMISAGAVAETEIIQVTVTGTDPLETVAIADAVTRVLPLRVADIIAGVTVKVVETAVMPTTPSSPSCLKAAVVGFLLGFLAAAGVVALRQIFDIRIRSEGDIAQVCPYPVLTAVPDLTASVEGHGKKKSSGPYAGFPAEEAYKLLRTKLQFSFSGDGECRVIGISSARMGEGKSLTAIRLAGSLSELGKRVLLVDCDMRRPSAARRLKLCRDPGLSDYLTGQTELSRVIQSGGGEKENGSFSVITAGQNPPNPSELLSSGKMHRTVSGLRKYYDYILLDLPPVGEVSDPLAVAADTDGIMLVVRQGYCDRAALGTAIRQFEFVNAKLLGLVFNATRETGETEWKHY